MQTKYCPQCQEIKSTVLFYRNSSNKQNCSAYCKVCQNKRTTLYVNANKEKMSPHLRRYSLKKRYGLSIEDYNTMLEKQNGVCAICKKPNSTNKHFAVDHCHSTKKIRGILCDNCNKGLGVYHDDTSILQNAILYLENSKNVWSSLYTKTRFT